MYDVFWGRSPRVYLILCPGERPSVLCCLQSNQIPFPRRKHFLGLWSMVEFYRIAGMWQGWGVRSWIYTERSLIFLPPSYQGDNTRDDGSFCCDPHHTSLPHDHSEVHGIIHWQRIQILWTLWLSSNHLSERVYTIIFFFQFYSLPPMWHHFFVAL